jgi:autotransporter passenger strand-loop-strand repeat protein
MRLELFFLRKRNDFEEGLRFALAASSPRSKTPAILPPLAAGSANLARATWGRGANGCIPTTGRYDFRVGIYRKRAAARAFAPGRPMHMRRNYGVIVSHGSSHRISSGGTDNGDIVLSGGKLFVLSGGVVDATTVSSRGSLAISGGGTDSGTTLVGGTASTAKLAIEVVSAGGTDLAAMISSGGLQEVFGYASGAKVSGAQSFFNPVFGGTQVIEAGGTASGTIVFSAGTIELLGTAIGNGFTVNPGGILEIASGNVLGGYVVSAESRSTWQAAEWPAVRSSPVARACLPRKTSARGAPILQHVFPPAGYCLRGEFPRLR